MINFKYLYKTVLIVLIVFHLEDINGQTYSTLIKDKDIIEFMNWKLNIDTTPNSEVPKEYFSFSNHIDHWAPIILKWDLTQDSATNNDFCIFNKRNKWLDTIFNEEGKEFLIKQSNSYIDSLWHIKTPINPKAKVESFHYCNLPLFSIDKQYVLFKEMYRCGGDCGEMGITIYKKINSSWTVYKSLMFVVF